jgi:hypothetical protein
MLNPWKKKNASITRLITKMIFGLIKDTAKAVINADVDSKPVNNIDKDNAYHTVTEIIKMTNDDNDNKK